MSVHYRDEGAGPLLLLIHGTSSSLHTWDGWVQRMRSGHRIIRLDLPGFGLTGPAPDADYRASRHARIVASLLDHLGVERADVAGNSLGGRVALTLALDYPARVNRLILVDSRGLSGQYPTTIERVAGIPVIGQVVRWATPRVLVRRAVEAVYADPSRVTDQLVDRYDDLIRRDGNRQAMTDAMAGPRDPDLDRRLSEIKVPVLLQWGEHDRRLPLSVAYRMRDGLQDARLAIYQNAGHVPMEELPAETSADAETFLREQSQRVKASEPHP
jgi:pimeloyl-ACP methyl ester carboxylesterase